MNWDVKILEGQSCVCDVFDMEDARMEEVLPGAGDVIIWESANAIIAPQRYSRLPIAPGFSHVGEWPCHERRSGGAPVPIGPGVLNLSMVLGWEGEPPSPTAIYSLLCAAPTRMLRLLGMEPSIGAVSGSYCDGSHNLVVEGRKVAGTAQRRKFVGAGPVRRLAIAGHMTLLIDADIDLLCSAVNRYLRLRGLPDAILPEVHVNLADRQCATRARSQYTDVAHLIAEGFHQ